MLSPTTSQCYLSSNTALKALSINRMLLLHHIVAACCGLFSSFFGCIRWGFSLHLPDVAGAIFNGRHRPCRCADAQRVQRRTWDLETSVKLSMSQIYQQLKLKLCRNFNIFESESWVFIGSSKKTYHRTWNMNDFKASNPSPGGQTWEKMKKSKAWTGKQQ